MLDVVTFEQMERWTKQATIAKRKGLVVARRPHLTPTQMVLHSLGDARAKVEKVKKWQRLTITNLQMEIHLPSTCDVNVNGESRRIAVAGAMPITFTLHRADGSQVAKVFSRFIGRTFWQHVIRSQVVLVDT